MIGEEESQIIYLFAMLLSFFASLILGQMTNIALRKAFSTIAGFLIGQFFFGVLWIYNLQLILVNYLFMRLFERNTAFYLITLYSTINLLVASCKV